MPDFRATIRRAFEVTGRGTIVSVEVLAGKVGVADRVGVPTTDGSIRVTEVGGVDYLDVDIGRPTSRTEVALRLDAIRADQVAVGGVIAADRPGLRWSANDDSILLRTDFTDDAAWSRLCAAIVAPVRNFRAYVTAVSDPAYRDATIEALVRVVPRDDGFLFVADRVALSEPAQAVLVVDLWAEPGRTFRVIPTSAWSVQNNLSLANMDFAEFADAVDELGIFRGF